MILDEKIIEQLKDSELPEGIRENLLNQVFSEQREERSSDLEKEKLELEEKKLRWNTPLVAALAGLLTLSATFVFDRVTARDNTANTIALQEVKAELERLSARDNTSNTITLEEVRNEFEQSEARLKQELETAASENLAKLEAEAREREFQYEIVRSELAKADKSNSDRAAVLLFLVRAGVLGTLNEEELREMAQQQIDNPDRLVVPELSSSGLSGSSSISQDALEQLNNLIVEGPPASISRTQGYDVIVQAGHVGRTSGATGAAGRHVNEQQIVLAISVLMARQLRESGFDVALVGADIPEQMSSAVFVSVHAAGSSTPCAAGPAVGYPPNQQYVEHAAVLLNAVATSLGYSTKDFLRDNYTAHLSNYYAYRRVDTTLFEGVIEVGELTCPNEEAAMINAVPKLGQNLATAVEFILKSTPGRAAEEQ